MLCGCDTDDVRLASGEGVDDLRDAKGEEDRADVCAEGVGDGHLRHALACGDDGREEGGEGRADGGEGEPHDVLRDADDTRDAVCRPHHPVRHHREPHKHHHKRQGEERLELLLLDVRDGEREADREREAEEPHELRHDRPVAREAQHRLVLLVKVELVELRLEHLGAHFGAALAEVDHPHLRLLGVHRLQLELAVRETHREHRGIVWGQLDLQTMCGG